MLDATQLSNLIEAITQAYHETFTSLQPTAINNLALFNLNFRSDPALSRLFDQGLISILNETNFLDHFNNLVENAVIFAKNVPYFMEIHEADRITLLKSCVFEIILVCHASCFSHESKTEFNRLLVKSVSESSSQPGSFDLATLAACAVAASTSEQTTNPQAIVNSLSSAHVRQSTNYFWVPGYETWASYEWICEKLPQLEPFLHLLVEFYQQFSTMKLAQTELALFCSYLLYNTDRGKIVNYKSLIFESFLNSHLFWS